MPEILDERLSLLDAESLSMQMLCLLAAHPAAPEPVVAFARDALGPKREHPLEWGPAVFDIARNYGDRWDRMYGHQAVNSSDPETRASASRRNKLTLEWASQLAADPEWEVRRGIADRRDAHVSHLRLLSRDPHPYVRRGVARNERTPLDALEMLLGDEDALVRDAAARNQSLPLGTLIASAEPHEIRVLMALARRAELSADALEELSESRFAEVRAAVASNPATPGTTLSHLAESPFVEISGEAAANPATPEAALTRLARKGDASVLIGLARNPALPLAALGVMLGRKASDATEALVTLASCPTAPPETLDLLVNSCGPEHGGDAVRAAAAGNPAAWPETLDRLSQSGVEVIVVAVASNPSAHPDVVEECISDLGWASNGAISTLLIAGLTGRWRPSAATISMLCSKDLPKPMPEVKHSQPGLFCNATAGCDDRRTLAAVALSEATVGTATLSEAILCGLDPQRLLQLTGSHPGPSDLTDPTLREAVLSSPDEWPDGLRVRIGATCSGADLARAATSSDPFLRLGAAVAPASASQLMGLARDTDQTIRRAVARRISRALTA